VLSRVASLGALAVAATAATTLLAVLPAAANGVSCPPGRDACVIVADTPPSRGSDDEAGDAAEDEGSPSAGGARPADLCPGTPGAPCVQPLGPQVPGGGVSVEAIALRAIELLPLRGPVIGIAPRPGGSGLVGLPVWMWTSVTPSTWGPVEATASVPGVAVTARAQASRITWSMGDGAAVVCAGPGTPYERRYGTRSSPTCGHLYVRASRDRPRGIYPVAATTTWIVSWSIVGGDLGGTVVTTRRSTTAVRINELQVVTE
jgi:hypothetical protein